MSAHSHSGPGLAVEVIAHSASRGEEEPRSVVIGGTRLEVREILSRSQQPSGRFFRVATSDAHVHELSAGRRDTGRRARTRRRASRSRATWTATADLDVGASAVAFLESQNPTIRSIALESDP